MTRRGIRIELEQEQRASSLSLSATFVILPLFHHQREKLRGQFGAAREEGTDSGGAGGCESRPAPLMAALTYLLSFPSGNYLKGIWTTVGMVAESYFFFGFVGGHIVTGGSNYCSQHLDGYLLLVKYNLLLNTMSDMDGARRWKA